MTIWFSASCSLTILPNSVLAGLALANHFRGRLEQADDLARGMGVTGEDARFGLSHHRLHQRHLVLELAAQPLENDLPVDVGRMLDAIADRRREALGLSDDPAGGRAGPHPFKRFVTYGRVRTTRTYKLGAKKCGLRQLLGQPPFSYS